MKEGFVRRWFKKSPAEITAARQRGWETRRKKYGKSGHAGVYERGPMWHTVRDEKRLARLVAVCLNDGLLTEGQVSKIIEADRLRVREVRDEGMMCLSYRPLLGEWGAATMNRMFG